jgi:hypothetical protein
MKLVKQTGKGFQYRLTAQEAYSLRLLVGLFPVGALSPVKISKSDPETEEREKLLNESLAAHRANLKRQAKALVQPAKFKTSGNHKLYQISHGKREVMLQILNDIRVESWRVLGEPENLETCTFELPQDKFKYFYLMYIAGEFEYHFLNLEEQGGKSR